MIFVFTGGVRDSMYGKLPRQIVSTFGYQGCLASLEFNGEAADPINNALIPSDFVNEGCEGNYNCSLGLHSKEYFLNAISSQLRWKGIHRV